MERRRKEREKRNDNGSQREHTKKEEKWNIKGGGGRGTGQGALLGYFHIQFAIFSSLAC